MSGWDNSDWNSSSWKSWSDKNNSWSGRTWKERDEAASAETGQSKASLRRKRLTHTDEGVHRHRLQHAIKKSKKVSGFSYQLREDSIDPIRVFSPSLCRLPDGQYGANWGWIVYPAQ